MSEEELPEGWAEARLGTLATKIGSGATPRGGSESYFSTGIPLIRSMNVHFDGFHEDGLVYLDDAQAAALKEVTVLEGDVLLNITGASIGRVTQAPGHMDGARVNQHVCIVRPCAELNAPFIRMFLQSPTMQDRIFGEEYGVTRQALTKGQILDFDVPVPPLAEQRRIVEKVEALLAQVNATRARLAKVPTILKRFRQSILSAACSGRLTEGWRLAQESVVDEEDWNESKFGDLLAVKPQNGLYRPQEDYGSGTPIVRIDSFYEGEIGAWNDLKKLRATKDDVRTYGLQPGDLLINRVNSPKFLGKSALVRSVPEPTVFESNIMRCHPDESRLFPEFAVRFLSSLEGLEELRKNAKHAVNQSSINQRDVMDVSVPVPHLPEQHEIVRRVEALFKLADTIEARVAAATARADKITQAILAKAFRGELVPTEAELARQEDRDYEPASALLARIRAARVDNDDKPTRRPRLPPATPASARAKPARQRTNGRTARPR